MSMKKIFYIWLILFLFTPVYAGDYMLFISDDYNAPCAERARKVHNWCKNQYKDDNRNCEAGWPIKSGKDVSASFIQYFNGKEPDIGILRAAFANGHFHFCSLKEVEEVYQTLISLKKVGVKANADHLEDFILKIENIR